MRILLVAATTFEVAPLMQALKEKERQPFHYTVDGLTIELLITGVGLPLTAFSLGHRLANSRGVIQRSHQGGRGTRPILRPTTAIN